MSGGAKAGEARTGTSWRGISVNLLGNLIQFQVFWNGVEEDQIGLEMERGMQCAAAVVSCRIK